MLAKRVYVCFIAVIFSIFINLIFIDASHADPLTITGIGQMRAEESQTLTVSGGTGPYLWSTACGGGSINSSTGAYTAPTSNPYCRNNGKVCVIDSYGQKECMTIAVNAYDLTKTAFIENKGCEDAPTPTCVIENYHCCTLLLYNCENTYIRFTNPCSGGYPCSWKEWPCARDCDSFASGDVRTAEMIKDGCCQSGPDCDNETNSKGNSCTNSQPVGSSANLKSGNLYHDQDVGILTLSYNSIDTYDGVLGKKWTHQYNQQLTIVSNDTLILRTEDGNGITFRLLFGIFYPEATSGDTSKIVKNANGTYTRTLKNGITQIFSASGLLTSITDRNSKTTTLTYSGNNLASIIDQNNRTTTITTTSGKITGITDALGRTHTLTYNSGLLTAVTDPLGNAWQYNYDTADTAGRMLTKIDPLGNTITYTYDTSGKLLTSTDPAGKVRAMNYTQSGTTTFTEKDGGAWTYTYDPVYSVKTSQIDPLGNTTRYLYDLKRNLITTIAPDGSITSYTYDANGNMLTQTDPLRKTTTYVYNSLNLVTSITDPRGNVTQYGYDALGNLTATTDALNNVTQYQYDSRGNITSITNPLNKTTTMTYDAYNNLRTVTDPKSGTVTMTYDAVGNMIAQTDPLGKETTFLYNNLNQMTQVTDPKGYITQYAYDYKGNRLSTTDGNNNPTWYAYDYKGQLTKITDALNNMTTMAYGGTGCSSCGTGVDKLTSLTDAKNHTTAYQYDLLGRLIQETDPLGKITSYTYDSKGNLITRTGPDNKTITYSYDLNNRLTQKLYSDSTVIAQFQYDDAGNMTYAGNQNIAYNFTYDANNRVTQITDSSNRTIQYTYDAAGNRATMITPGNKTIAYAYDNNNQISQIATDLGNFTFAYDTNNRRTTRTLPNGTTSTYAYDDDSRLTGIITTNGGTTIDTVAYTHDGVGNRLSKTQQGVTSAYSYDAIYRLTLATPSGGSYQPEAYTYDAVGNRLTGINEQVPAASETAGYGYDGENRLTAVQITRNGKIKELAFAYDPFGKRISKTIIKDEIGTDCTAPNICPRTTTYVYDNQNIILEYNASNEIITRYTHGPNIDEPLAMQQNANTYYYHADGLGSITALTNASGNVVQRYEYDSFGTVTISTNGGIVQPYTFTAREYDSETGLYFYRARYYDPKAGRFITKDPISFNGGDVNLYAYVSNNPVNRIDPLGLLDVFAFIEGDLVGILGVEGAIGFVIDLKNPGQSGFFVSVGPAAGANAGWGAGGGIVKNDVEGWSYNVDVNFGAASVTGIFDDSGFNGIAGSIGPGIGLSASATKTWTYSINDLIKFAKGFSDNKKKGPCK